MSMTSPLATLFGLDPAMAAMLAVFLSVGLLTLLIAWARFQPLLAFVVASLAAFAVVLLVTRHHPAGAAHALADYRGLARREPVASAVLGFALV
ncbi:MAG: hypothetical protein ACLGI6_08440, partial [Gammaproteobacteria bacterium]